MGSMFSETGKNAYGVTYATLDERGLHFESELAIQLLDGPLVTLKMPTQISERQAIGQLVSALVR
ncbi:MAG: type III secretion system co-regulatory protein PtrC [Pseudomonas sp.]